MTAPSPNRRYQQLRSHLTYLKLNAAAEHLAQVLDDATEDADHVAVLERLLGIEVEATATRRQESRRRLAGLPAPWRIEDFDFDAQPTIDRNLVMDLATMRFIDQAGNVLFIGPPGVGKTMLAVALGHAAIDAGHRVYYTTAADLVARCHKAAIEGRWANTMRFFAAPQLLIIDELGYLPLAGEAASALFQVINRRYGHGSIILTTNRGISQWGAIFDDPIVAAAMLDRLMHRSAIIAIDGESYRMRAHREQTETLRTALAVNPQ